MGRVLAALALSVALWAPTVRAEAGRPSLPRAAALARLCVSEAGWDMSVGCEPATLNVFLEVRRAR